MDVREYLKNAIESRIETLGTKEDAMLTSPLGIMDIARDENVYAADAVYALRLQRRRVEDTQCEFDYNYETSVIQWLSCLSHFDKMVAYHSLPVWERRVVNSMNCGLFHSFLN